MSMLSYRFSSGRTNILQKLRQCPPQRHQLSSLREILAKMSETPSGQEESAKIGAASAIKPKLDLGLSNKGGVGSPAAKKQGASSFSAALNLGLAKTQEQKKGKFSVDVGGSPLFAPKSATPTSSIREAIRKAEEAKAAVKNTAVQGLPGSLTGSLFGARPAQVTDGAPSSQATSFAERKAAFEAKWASMVPSTPLYQTAPAVEERSKAEKAEDIKRQKFDERMGLDKNWRSPKLGDGEFGWHRDLSQMRTAELPTVNVSQLKAELLRKKVLDSSSADDNIAVKVEEKVAGIPEDGCSVRELSQRLSVKSSDLTRKLVDMGVLRRVRRGKDATIMNEEKEAIHPDDRYVDADSAELLALDMGYVVRRIQNTKAARVEALAEKPSVRETVTQLPRAPIVCVMGHVDHGKTTLLDTLRKYNHNGGAVSAANSSSSSKKKDKKSKAPDGPTEVAGTEAGGITQKLSAFGVSVSEGRRLMFLDTPGHAAFTAMRSHGATATDLVILVVAIDDGVRPQTVEALKMAKDAGCSIIVALNKIDRIPATEREAARGRVLSQLMSHQLVAEEYGGDVQVVEVAGRTGEGIPELMESLLLQAEVLELKAAFEGRAEAVVLDASLEKGKGVVAEVLVRWGSLNVGDAIVVGGSYGKVKSMINDRGETVRTALPSDAVRLLGLRELPVSGQEMLGVESEDAAREVAERRMAEVEAKRVREQDLVRKRLEMKARMEAAAAAEASGDAEAKAKAAAALAAKPIKIDVVIKADGVGTLQALERIVQGVASRTLKGVVVDVVHSAVGEVTNSDLDLASAGEDALILAFNVGVVDGDTRSRAKLLDINICRSDIIYRLEDELVKAILDHLPKERSLVKEGTAKVQQVFDFSGGKSKVVAGIKVETGAFRTKVPKGSSAGSNGEKVSGYVFSVKRKGEVVLQECREGDSELKRLKEAVNEVEAGLECGLTLHGYNDFQEGDEIECYKVVWTPPTDALSAGDSGVVRTDGASGGSGVQRYGTR